MHRPKLVKPFGAISSRPLANAKRWCMPNYQATSRKMSPQQCERRRAMFGRCLADDVLLPGVPVNGDFKEWEAVSISVCIWSTMYLYSKSEIHQTSL
ncbi:hypothetical protein AVEN_73158-1 [Araneus ventricosus]|uniref:Uncharacterized protein n=1 Tax=Araneus ventricosus TaxID=182803 RepID=A0A4Y2WI97_ARAVE|nr:hypothetical protein AVEN_73158-1 [Araneus ventricosus]